MTRQNPFSAVYSTPPLLYKKLPPAEERRTSVV